MEDELPLASSFSLEQEEGWSPPAIESVPWLAFFDSDEDPATNLGNFSLDYHEPWIAATISTPWLPRPALDDEISTNLSSFYLEQEEPWIAAVVTMPWLSRPGRDDEISTSLANFTLEQEDAWSPALIATPWQPRPATDEDPYPVPTMIGIMAEQAYVPAILSTPWLPRPFTDDEISTSLANCYLEHHEPWTGLRTAMPWTAVVVQDEDPCRAPVLYLEDEACFVTTTTAIAWLPRPFSYDEISTSLANCYLDQEEGWRRPAVTSVAWCVWPFRDDEIKAVFSIVLSWWAWNLFSDPLE